MFASKVGANIAAAAASVVLVALTGGCAGLDHAIDARRAPMPLSHAGKLTLAGGPAAAPAGLVALCASGALRCDATALAELDGEATGAAGVRPRSSNADAASMFRALLVQRMGEPQTYDAPKLQRVEFNEDLWRTLVDVNDDVNWAIAPDTDGRIYGVEERWALPLRGANLRRARGDCEDYALEKRADLIDAGLPAESLSLVTAIAPGIGRHAVLLVRTSRGDFVLDNLHEAPMAIDALPYVWLSLQSGDGLLNWANVRLEAASAWASLEQAEEVLAGGKRRFEARLEGHGALKGRLEI